MIRSEASPQINPLLFESTATPAPLGLVFFGLTFLLLNLDNAGFFPLSPLILALGVFYGATGQIFVGILEWRRNQVFGAVSFTAFGLFWLSLIALTVLPRAGFGELPEAAAMTAYYGMWCIFAGILMIGAFPLGRVMQLIFAAFFLYLLLHTVATCGFATLAMITGYEGILGGVAAVYTGIVLAIAHRSRTA